MPWRGKAPGTHHDRKEKKPSDTSPGTRQPRWLATNKQAVVGHPRARRPRAEVKVLPSEDWSISQKKNVRVSLFLTWCPAPAELSDRYVRRDVILNHADEIWLREHAIPCSKFALRLPNSDADWWTSRSAICYELRNAASWWIARFATAPAARSVLRFLRSLHSSRKN
jgi:hypothetical protein